MKIHGKPRKHFSSQEKLVGYYIYEQKGGLNESGAYQGKRLRDLPDIN